MLTVAAFYCFADMPDPAACAATLRAMCQSRAITGTAILAPEGINGTMAGPPEAIAALRGHITGWPGFAAPEWKESTAAVQPFRRLKIRLKPEIVTLGAPLADPRRRAGTRVAPQDWNALIAAPDVAVIDTRNRHEVAAGTFPGAIDPGINRFTDFPAWWAAVREGLKGKRIAMFCTGGVRCEKATSLLLAEGLSEVFHLSGGVLNYLVQVPSEDSRWQGECFVFDERVAVGPGMVPGTHATCPDCGWPVPQGAVCPNCAPVGTG